MRGKNVHDALWWSSFQEKVKDCANKRNRCCHAGLFTWRDHESLLSDIFRKGKKEKNRDRKIDGLLFESQVGKELKRLR